jgi:hypothetical protein
MEVEENNWCRIRNNNGEWISEIHIEILDEGDLQLFEILSSEEGKELEKHYGTYDTGEPFVWCYKNDVWLYKIKKSIFSRSRAYQ